MFPRYTAARFHLTQTGTTTRDGRATVALHGDVPLYPGHRQRVRAASTGARGIDLLVDAATGIVVRSERASVVAELTQLHVDDEFPADTFALEVPPMKPADDRMDIPRRYTLAVVVGVGLATATDRAVGALRWLRGLSPL